MSPAKLQPAVLGGLAIGVLSALPFVNIVNLCCCAWVVFGGALAVYLMQQNHPAPIEAGDGAIVGLMAGAFGAIIGSLLSIPIAMAMGPFQADMLQQVMENAQDMPPEVRDWFERMAGGMATGAALGVTFVFTMVFSLFLYSFFGMLGGLLGAMLFRKNTPPPPPPVSGFPPPPPPLPPNYS